MRDEFLREKKQGKRPRFRNPRTAHVIIVIVIFVIVRPLIRVYIILSVYSVKIRPKPTSPSS